VHRAAFIECLDSMSIVEVKLLCRSILDPPELSEPPDAAEALIVLAHLGNVFFEAIHSGAIQ
jgi:hypothetical protein